MVRIVHNSKLLLATYLSLFVIVALSFIPLYEWGMDSSDGWLIFLGITGFIGILLLIIKPSYAAFEIMNNTLYVTTDNEEDTASWVELPLEDIVDFKITSKLFGLKKEIYFIKSANGGYQRSKSTNISLFTTGMVVKLNTMLSPFRKADLKID